MGELINLPYKYRLFTIGEEKTTEYVVYHPSTFRVVLTGGHGMYQHIEIVTMNLVTHGWRWESEGEFKPHGNEEI